MTSTVLVPLDGSRLAERALPYAARLARAAHGRMVLVRVALVQASPELLGEARGAVTEWLRAELEAVAAQLRRDDIPVETRVYEGEPGATIADAASREHAHLIVMSSHGRSGLGRWIFGSVAEEVLRRAEVPVLLVPAAGEQVWDARKPARLLVPLDGSDLSEAALGPACDLARLLDAEMLLLRVVEPSGGTPLYAYGAVYAATAGTPPEGAPGSQSQVDDAQRYLDDVAARVRGRVRAVRLRVEVGNAASAIAAVAREESPDAIVMATHRRDELTRLVLGSVAMATLHRTSVPVLLVRSPAPGAAAPLSITETAAPPREARTSAGGEVRLVEADGVVLECHHPRAGIWCCCAVSGPAQCCCGPTLDSAVHAWMRRDQEGD